MKYIIDLDGTLLNSDLANLDAVEFVKTLQESSMEFLIMTNSIKSPSLIKNRLKQVDIHVGLEQIINPIVAMNLYTEKNNYKKAYAIGSQTELDQLSIELDHEHPEIILLLDFEKNNIGYSELQKIFDWIDQGVPVVTASRSHYYLKSGKKTLDTGAFVTLLESVSDVTIEVIGKPSKEYFMAGVRKLNAQPEEVTVIGDDWRTDVLGASKAGCESILIQSGKYQAGDEVHCKDSKCVKQLMHVLKP
ncbi:MAG: HAD hydrolase-like protein [Clostridiales bacterium]|nr:HAD hydrolase-like protein [Clostridiales bacterium]